jgi:uncharacterized protein (TIGR03546 family)
MYFYSKQIKEEIILFKGIAKLILALNGNVSKTQIAAGFAWGLLLGLVPAGNAFWIVLFLLTFFFTHHHGAKISALAFVKILLPLFVYEIDKFGWFILHIDSLRPLFTSLYNMPFVPFTKFNNTLVMGGLAAGILLWLPVFFLFLGLIPLFRNTIGPKIRNLKIIQAIAKFPLFSFIDNAIKG